MDLQAALIERHGNQTRGPRCTVCKFIDSEHSAAADLEAALSDSEYTATVIEQALNDVGVFHLRAQTLQRHRRGACSG